MSSAPHDTTTRLRDYADRITKRGTERFGPPVDDDLREAADEIERMRADEDRFTEALAATDPYTVKWDSPANDNVHVCNHCRSWVWGRDFLAAGVKHLNGCVWVDARQRQEQE